MQAWPYSSHQSTVWRLETKDVCEGSVKLCTLVMFDDGECYQSSLPSLCCSWLVLTSVLSVKAVAVVGSVGITIQLN